MCILQLADGTRPPSGQIYVQMNFTHQNILSKPLKENNTPDLVHPLIRELDYRVRECIAN